MSKIPLLAPRLSEMTPLSFLEHIKTLRIVKETKASTAVPDITLTWNENRKILRINREEKKKLLLTEIEALAKEKNVDTATLLNFMTERKIKIEDSNGLWINEWADKPKRKRAENAEANAGTKRRRSKQKDNISNQLVEPVDNAGVPRQS